MIDSAINPDPLLSVADAARWLGLTDLVKDPAQSVRALCRRRKLRSTKVAGKVMIRESWLEAYIAENAREVPSQDTRCRENPLEHD